jgi:hypothetical protein
MISTNEFKAIAELDLDPIKVKLMHKESGEGWTREYANLMEIEYRRFLCLTKMFPDEAIAPLLDVDVFWHYHILDTMKYAADCESVFGHFLHHYPYLGMHGEEDRGQHQRVGNRMMELYEEAFGEPCVREESEAGAGALARGDTTATRSAWYFEGGNIVKSARTAWCFVNENSAKSARTARYLEGGHSAKATSTAWCFVAEESAKSGATARSFEGLAPVKSATHDRLLAKRTTLPAM